MCAEEFVSYYEAITLLHLTHYCLIQCPLSILDFINLYYEMLITLRFHLKSSVEIASLTMWLISYICIIVCTLNCFKTSVNDIVWIRGMSTFSAIDQKRKISIKKLELLVYLHFRRGLSWMYGQCELRNLKKIFCLKLENVHICNPSAGRF